MTRVIRTGLITALATLSAMATVQAATVAGSEADAKKAIEARQELFKQIKDLNEPIRLILTRKAPMDATVVATNAGKIQELIKQIPGRFTVDTRGFKGIKTLAIDGIWNSEVDFKGKADAAAGAAGDVVTAAKGGDNGAIMKSLAAMGKSCGSCHDAYKASND
jgi:cytochrome c556